MITIQQYCTHTKKKKSGEKKAAKAIERWKVEF